MIVHRVRWFVALLLLALVAFGLGSVLNAQSASEPTYQRTVTAQEALNYFNGAKLDQADPQYCEKTRDLCLAALCGATTRENTRRACWRQCTRTLFDRCEKLRSAR